MAAEVQYVEAPVVEEEDDEEEEEDDEEECDSWVRWFCEIKGNEYFCEVDLDFLLDRFNLTGLGNDVPHAQQAYEIITDHHDAQRDEVQNSLRLDSSARFLYGLIHARFIISPAGLSKMKRKYLSGTFGQCPRVLCGGQNMIPVGLSDLPGVESVKLFCRHCGDVYNPRSSAHNAIDGAFFGTTFAHLFFTTYASLLPKPSTDVYTPKIFGFRIAGARSLARLHEQIDDVDSSLQILNTK